MRWRAERKRAAGARRRSSPTLQARRARPGRRSTGRSPPGPRSSTSIDARRDLNAQLTGELAERRSSGCRRRSRSSTRQRRRAVLPLRPFQGALPWPARGRVTRRFGRQPSSRFGTADRPKRHRDRRSPRASRSGASTKAWSPSPTSSPATATSSSSSTASGRISLYGYLGAVEVARASASTRRRCSGRSGPEPQRQPGAVLRAARRRQAGRSLTMAEEAALISTVGSEHHDFEDPPVRPAHLDAGAGVRHRRRPDGPGALRPATAPSGTCACSTTSSSW